MAAIALLVMIVVAASQALLRNLTNLDVGWANLLLTEMEGVDSFLQKGTLWLAFLGASLATHEDRHIAIDILPRIAPPRVRAVMRGTVGFIAGTVSFFLGLVFWEAVLNNAQDRPFEYEVLADGQAVHLCDAPAQALVDAGLDSPTLFCAIRSLLNTLGAPVETPGAAAQLIVPVMFLAMALRLLIKGVGAFTALARGEADGRDTEGLERVATEASTDTPDKPPADDE